MSSLGDATVPATRRPRQSIGSHTGFPKMAADQENATVDVTSQATFEASRNKSRSKSIGPGGLDALKQSAGNRRASLAAPRSILKPRMSILPEISSPPKHKRRSEAHRTSDRSLQKFSDEPTVSRIALRTEEEQQAAAREREERDRRDARRKSLANRRVSFAAEATLHTFHIEYMQDSTTSTDSSRRASTLSVASQDTTGYGPSIEHTGNENNATGNQRRSSLARRSDDDTITSTYSSDSEPADAVEEVIDEEDEDDMDSSNSESEDGTMMTIDTEDITGVSMGSDAFDQDSESSLDLALRQAAERANTQQLESEHGSQGFDEEEEIIPSFGWVKKPVQASAQTSHEPQQTQVGMEMDMTSAIGGIINADDTVDVTQYEDMSMDVTNVLGGILGNRTLVGVDAGDATMDFTTALGGIQQHEENEDTAEFEDMSMELTTVLGGVLPQKQRQSLAAPRRRTVSQADDADDGMDMTVGLGNILSTEADNTAMNDSNDTMGMDMTMVLGGIVGGETSDGPVSPVKKLARSHSSFFVPDSSPIVMSPKRASPRRTPQLSKKAPSPGLFARGQLPVRTKTPSPQEETHRSMRMTRSRSRSLTPSPTKARSATKSPKTRAASAKPATPIESLKPTSTNTTPSRASPKQSKTKPGLVLQTPPSRRLSGIGADRDGLGSPTVASIIDRRASIGDSASQFVPGQPLITFDSPKDLARVMAKEDADMARESQWMQANNGGVSFTQEDRDATASLMDLIGSLSPAKKPLNGRKSLHVGSAKGVLGKRPAELDGEEDDTYEEKDGVDRLRGHQSSPVKKIRLQKPTFGVDMGKLAWQNSAALDLRQATTPNRLSPVKSVQAPATTPRRNGGFRDVRDHHTIHEMSLDVQGPLSDSDQIRLQDFLDMTSIRFMELNTTKRRHTTAPSTLVPGDDDSNTDDMSLERCVVASACTVPKLELFQHSCRELKKYISEGRRMVKEIEEDTYEDNPPLFKEYMSAAPDVKALMDNQFKNVKTHARLLSKAMWYEWRMKLQDGLKEGLMKIDRDMDQDFVYLAEQEELLASILPELDQSFDKLDAQRQDLETVARELADCDPEVLNQTRAQLGSLKDEIEEKKRQIEQLQSEYKASTLEAEELSMRKEAFLADIAQSEKTREDCRGWNSSEVRAIKERVDALEEEFGWAVTGISGSILSMSYKREIELVVDASSFEAQGKPSQVDLWYIADSREAHPVPRTVEKEFFLQCIRENIRSLPQQSTDIATLLKTVQKDWDTARFASAQIQRLTTTFPTKVTKSSDTNIQLSTSMLLRTLSTRIEIVSEFQGDVSKNGLGIKVTNSAEVQYGQHFQVNKIKDFLTARMGTSVQSSGDSWCDAFVELQGKLIARGKK